MIQKITKQLYIIQKTLVNLKKNKNSFFYWARKVGLRRVGEVQLYHPFDDDPIYAPLSVDTEEEFEVFNTLFKYNYINEF